MYNSGSQVNRIDNKRFQGNLDMFGVYSRNIPTLSSCDMNRIHMSNCEQEQAVQLFNAEFPLVYSGCENEFSKYSSGYTELEGKWKIIKRIDKNKFVYALIIKKLSYSEHEKKRMKRGFEPTHKVGEYHVIFREEAGNLTESYGYVYNNEIIDSLESGDVVEDEIINHDLNRDDNMNLTYGVNAMCVYAAIGGYNTEDAIPISKEFAEKASYPTVPKVRVALNDNDILINRYGSKEYYKAFPDIGEEVKNGIICSSRRINYEKVPFSLRRLNKPLQEDTNYYIRNGIIVDIDVISNIDDPETEFAKIHNLQIGKYYRQQQNYYKNFVKYCDKIVSNEENICSDDLIHYYNHFKIRSDPNIRFRVDKSLFNYLIIEFTVLSKNELTIGNKLAGRYGDKGVISKIFDKDSIFEIEDFSGLGPIRKDTKINFNIHMALNPTGTSNRMNIGQNIEQEINANSLLVRYKMEGMLDYDKEPLEKVLKYLYGYFNVISKEQCQNLKSFIKTLTNEEIIDFLHGLIENGIPIMSQPFYDNINIEVLTRVYEYTGLVPSKFKGIEEELIPGEKYNLNLKHFPSTKFSVRSIDQNSIKNLPVKNVSYKEFKSIFSSTPIKTGEMEVSGLNLANSYLSYSMRMVKNFLDSYANNETDRLNLIKTQLKDNPYDFSFKNSKTISENSKVVKSFLLSMGVIIKE